MDDSFAKGLRVLETLAVAEEPLGLMQVAERSKLIKSHAHKFLRTLIDEHYVEQLHDRGPYRLTFKLFELGARTLVRTDLVSAARVPMQEITAKTGETSTIAVFDGGDAIYVYKIDGTREVRTNTDVGRRRPAYCVAAGKAILAFLPQTIAEGVATRIKRHTVRTMRNKSELLDELAGVRKRGYAVNWGEWVDTVRGLAAPIRNVEGHVIAALNLSIPAERLDKKAVTKLAPMVMDSAMQISRSLGFSETRFGLRESA